MKILNKFLVASLLIMIVGNVNAQDENNPWAISAGADIVDFFPTGADQDRPSRAGERGNLFEEFFNAEDHWNSVPTLSYVNVSRYIGKGIVVGANATINEIDRFGGQPANDLEYVALDGEISYGFKKLLKSKWLDPYVQIGGGYTWLENQGSEGLRGFGTANGGVGFRFWFNENVNLGVESVFKQDFNDNEDNQTINTPARAHFQHLIGIGVAFGGRDTDRDGILDKNDSCPNVAGLPQFNGCPDTDGDGIEDSKDACPTVAGFAEFNGCSDTDGDGIPDDKDACPKVAGINALSGCPDRDSDGIKDSSDNCPNEAGPRSNGGCPFEDTDGDGVLDKNDHCPTVAGIASQNGCPKVDAPVAASSQMSLDVLNDLNIQFRSVLFDNNKATIRSESYGVLNNVASIMQNYPNTVFLVEGHTDSRGSDSYNLNLSDRRAASVRTYLTGKGLSNSRIQSRGFGEVRPIATNETETGRQTNRRVELSIISQ